MPKRPKKPCKYPQCPRLTNGGYCEVHKNINNKYYDQNRESSSKRGYDYKWTRFRKAYLSSEENALCRECLSNGRLIPATEIDHITPMSKGGDKYDETNLQPLCKSCHSRKTVKEDGGLGNL